MTNEENLRGRYAALIDFIRQTAGDDARIETVATAVKCNGCDKYFDYPETDFTFWTLGAYGMDADYCPACGPKA